VKGLRLVPLFDQAIALCREAGFGDVLLRGDNDFSLTGEFDRWDSDGVRFVFGYDAGQPRRASRGHPRRPLRPAGGPGRAPGRHPTRTRPANAKDEVVRARGYKVLRPRAEEVGVRLPARQVQARLPDGGPAQEHLQLPGATTCCSTSTATVLRHQRPPPQHPRGRRRGPAALQPGSGRKAGGGLASRWSTDRRWLSSAGRRPDVPWGKRSDEAGSPTGTCDGGRTAPVPEAARRGVEVVIVGTSSTSSSTCGGPRKASSPRATRRRRPGCTRRRSPCSMARLRSPPSAARRPGGGWRLDGEPTPTAPPTTCSARGPTSTTCRAGEGLAYRHRRGGGLREQERGGDVAPRPRREPGGPGRPDRRNRRPADRPEHR
jgi:hypothetical protein